MPAETDGVAQAGSVNLAVLAVEIGRQNRRVFRVRFVAGVAGVPTVM